MDNKLKTLMRKCYSGNPINLNKLKKDDIFCEIKGDKLIRVYQLAKEVIPQDTKDGSPLIAKLNEIARICVMNGKVHIYRTNVEEIPKYGIELAGMKQMPINEFRKAYALAN
jgi:hypothetical protein